MKTVFQFRSSDFNITDSRDYFINTGCFGDDLAQWMIDKLSKRGIATSPAPSQEDFGWYFRYSIQNKEYCVVIGFQPNDVSVGDCWIGEIERHVGLVGSILGKRREGIDEVAIEIIDRVLRSSPEIRDLEWVTAEP